MVEQKKIKDQSFHKSSGWSLAVCQHRNLCDIRKTSRESRKVPQEHLISGQSVPITTLSYVTILVYEFCHNLSF